MTSYVIPAHDIVGLPVAGTTDLFPVRRVYCVGRNYAAHAREMGYDPDREPPFFFCKPNDAQALVPVAPGQVVELPYPQVTSNLHYECELWSPSAGGAATSPWKTRRSTSSDTRWDWT